ncbi:MAG: hypothetical protein ABW131_05750 [Candidatus Sedimenticola sp. 6PFRAG5]
MRFISQLFRKFFRRFWKHHGPEAGVVMADGVPARYYILQIGTAEFYVIEQIDRYRGIQNCIEDLAAKIAELRGTWLDDMRVIEYRDPDMPHLGTFAFFVRFSDGLPRWSACPPHIAEYVRSGTCKTGSTASPPTLSPPR